MAESDLDESERESLTADDLREVWPFLTPAERVEGLRVLDRPSAEEFFLAAGAHEQADLLLAFREAERRSWMRLLAPDDAADVIQEAPADARPGILALLDDASRREVQALLAHAEDEAGGLMSPRFARVRPEMSADEAIAYLRRQTRDRAETIYYAYALDAAQKLLGVVSFRELILAPGDRRVMDIMRTDVRAVPETMDQEAASLLFAEADLLALPVVDSEGRMKGILTADDIVDVVQEEATEDIQKLGGMAATDKPYLENSLGAMIRKRAGWLSVLFVGETLTASAMGAFEGSIARAIVLTLFIPLIISSGGNSGSQATSLVIRAMALDQIRLRDWWRVVRREVSSGLVLGAILGVVGFIRVMLGEFLGGSFGAHWYLIGATISVSLVGIVTFGTVMGSMLPFLFRRLGFDPASASAPFVATLVDVAGVVIYFGTANLLLTGTVL